MEFPDAEYAINLYGRLHINCLDKEACNATVTVNIIKGHFLFTI